MDRVSKHNVAHRYAKRKLLIAINCVAGLSIFFFGYDQGMMAGVNNAVNYYDTTMKLGYEDSSTGSPVITNSLLQGGIVSVYYLGTLVGCLAGGILGDRYGRIKSIAIGAGIAVVGATLQCSAQNSTWMIFARLINGWGTGILNAIVPVWATETAEHTSRGQFVAIEFTLNIFGVVVAYWLEYGCAFYGGEFEWRFPIAFQILPLLGLFAIVWFFPESPRWLVKVGREEEARWILGRLRGDEQPEDIARADAEFADIKGIADLESKTAKQMSYFRMAFGSFGRSHASTSESSSTTDNSNLATRTDSKSLSAEADLHLPRRVQLVIWLQIMQEWIGIAGVTVYAPTIFRIAGISNSKVGWISGLNNIFYMFATLICVFTLDRIGRRWTLYWGSVAQGIVMFLAGAFSRLGTNAKEAGHDDLASSYGIAAVSMVFIFTSVFGATWLTVPWLYPAEIFPLAVRAKGNAFGVFGWSIGNGWLTLLCPVMFGAISEKTLYIFGACNVITIPMVWALYPESNGRTLEEMDLLFASKTPWVWDAEREFERLRVENPGLVQAAKRGESVVSATHGDLESGDKAGVLERE